METDATHSHPDHRLRLPGLTVTMVAAFLIFLGCIVLMEIEPFSFTAILFKVCSAFGTTGLSMGITAQLSPLSKLVIIGLMFIGRIGILALMFFPQSASSRRELFHYPKERIIVGH